VIYLLLSTGQRLYSQARCVHNDTTLHQSRKTTTRAVQISYRCIIKAQTKGLTLRPQAGDLLSPDNPPADTSDLHQREEKEQNRARIGQVQTNTGFRHFLRGRGWLFGFCSFSPGCCCDPCELRRQQRNASQRWHRDSRVSFARVWPAGQLVPPTSGGMAAAVEAGGFVLPSQKRKGVEKPLLRLPHAALGRGWEKEQREGNVYSHQNFSQVGVFGHSPPAPRLPLGGSFPPGPPPARKAAAFPCSSLAGARELPRELALSAL